MRMRQPVGECTIGPRIWDHPEAGGLRQEPGTLDTLLEGRGWSAARGRMRSRAEDLPSSICVPAFFIIIVAWRNAA
jgi:hypothetical protein